MSKLEIPTRLGPPTNASLQADIPVHRRIVSDRCADLEAAVRAMARLVTTPDEQRPSLGFNGALVHPPTIDRDALEVVADEALRDTQFRLGELQALVANLLGPRRES